MKKGPRCPVCGSLQIKEAAAQKPADVKAEAEKPAKEGASKWKCYDCYRHFEKPDETS